MSGLPPAGVERERDELRAYLGEAYDEDRLRLHRREVERELERVGDEDRFYRTSEAYLYDLTAFAMSQTKRPYLEAVAALATPGARLLDFGCGIGSDGLAMIEAGYEVTFADFDNPSTRYLRWRLERRDLDARIVDVDRQALPGGHDLAYAWDVLEHVDDVASTLARLEAAARVVAVNLLEPGPGDPPHHREMPISGLLDRAARGRVRHYRVHHGRSHLIAYEAGPAGALGRARSRAALTAGRLRS